MTSVSLAHDIISRFPEIEINKIDKINDILVSILPDFFQPKKKFPCELRKWTKEDKFYLLINLIREEPRSVIAESIHRTPNILNVFLNRLKAAKIKNWTPDNKCQILTALANKSWITFVNTLIRDRKNKNEKNAFINLLAQCNWSEEQKNTLSLTVSNQCNWTTEHRILFSKTRPVNENTHEEITSLLSKIFKKNKKKSTARENRILFLRKIAGGESFAEIRTQTKLKNKTILSFLKNKNLKNHIYWSKEEQNYMLQVLNIYEETVLALQNQPKKIEEIALIDEEQNRSTLHSIDALLLHLLPDFNHPEIKFPPLRKKWSKNHKFTLLINFCRGDKLSAIAKTLERSLESVSSYLHHNFSDTQMGDLILANPSQTLQFLAKKNWEKFVKILGSNRMDKQESPFFLNALRECQWDKNTKEALISAVSDQCEWKAHETKIILGESIEIKQKNKHLKNILKNIFKKNETKSEVRKSRIQFLKSVAAGEPPSDIAIKARFKEKTTKKILSEKGLENYINWTFTEKTHLSTSIKTYEEKIETRKQTDVDLIEKEDLFFPKKRATSPSVELEVGFNRDFLDLWDEDEIKQRAEQEKEKLKKIRLAMDPILESLFPDFFNPQIKFSYTASKWTKEDKFHLLIGFARKDSRETIAKTIHRSRNTFNQYLSKNKLTSISKWTSEDHGQMLDLLATKCWEIFIAVLKSNRKDKKEKDDFFTILAHCNWTKKEKEDLVSSVSADCHWKKTQITNFLNSNNHPPHKNVNITNAFNKIFKKVKGEYWTREARILLLQRLIQGEDISKNYSTQQLNFLHKKKLKEYLLWGEEEKAYLLAALETYEASTSSLGRKRPRDLFDPISVEEPVEKSQKISLSDVDEIYEYLQI